ncbi:hypothetical protein [Argonema antarcticum]|uniref:hypothetical protein n=1 Tax=Argonema antarcticum TaxID=2942763 RepID=UPI0020125687|nr:hypothetical protein [Argonema antarcticum]MCL1472256.1 hypothetical protein [Argonema antarcticum A004/B2]
MLFLKSVTIGVPNREPNLGAKLKSKSNSPLLPYITKAEPENAQRRQKGKERKETSFLSYFLVFSFYFLLSEKILAQPAPPMPLFDNLTIGPGFKPDPRTIRGISGGLERASDIAGRQETANGPCVGFVGKNPSHTLVLSSPFNYLRVQVQSPDDTTLVIQGPGGTWCNDDSEGKNAGIAGEWLPGTYSIWIGSYQKNKYTPYIIRVTQVQ